MAGLLHNIGELFLIFFFSGPMQEVRSVQRQQSIPDYEAEQVILGAPHTLVGQWIALHWNLPPVFDAAIEQHHRPDPDDDYFPAAAVHAAGILCNPEADEEEWRDTPFDASVEAYLGLSKEDRRTLRERYVSDLASAEAFLNLSV
ncbi:MAG: HDOD domain-containing protein [Armatimonadetes bacterium]|nr:HDOD domain-containing protein [Armatimonadota bacterium]